MNFDKIKDNWKQDTSKEIAIPKKMEKLKSSHRFTKLQRNMKIEFYAQLLAIFFLAFVPQLYQFDHRLYFLYYISYSTLVIISAYYLYNFYLFYRQFQQFTDTARNTLNQLYTILRLNMERYKAFAFLLIPHIISCVLFFAYNKLLSKNQAIDSLTEKQVVALAIVTLTLVIIYIIAILLWVDKYYGRYAREIKSILQEMDDDNS